MVITNMGVFCSALPQEGDGDPVSEGVFTDPFFPHYSKQNTWFSEHFVSIISIFLTGLNGLYLLMQIHWLAFPLSGAAYHWSD
jgi:hypothetical protein